MIMALPARTETQEQRLEDLKVYCDSPKGRQALKRAFLRGRKAAEERQRTNTEDPDLLKKPITF